MTVAPPIPGRLLHRPTIAGRVIPWVNVRLADGGVDFRGTHRRKVEQAWTDRLCQVDGQPLDATRMVLMCGPNQLHELAFDEPAVHPECARYTVQACEMVAGRMARYATGPSVSETHRGAKCFDPACSCDGWVPEGVNRGGDAAHSWYAVWVAGYHVAMKPDGSLHGGAVSRRDVLGVRVVLPGDRRVWRRLSDDELGALIVDPAVDRDELARR